MGFEYLDLVDTVDRLHELCEKLNIKQVIKGDAKQIEIVVEIKERNLPHTVIDRSFLRSIA